MDATTETRSAAANFLAAHDKLTNDLADAKLINDDQRKEIERLDGKLSLQNEMLAQAVADKNLYLQYSFELAAQLQFMVAGSARALMIAGSIRNTIAMKAANVPPVAGTDVAELEGILQRIGNQNAAANDGTGMTNGDGKPVETGKPQIDVRELAGSIVADGSISVGKPIHTGRMMAGSTSPQDGPAAIIDAPQVLIRVQDGTLVDRDGKPIKTDDPIEPSNATRTMLRS